MAARYVTIRNRRWKDDGTLPRPTNKTGLRLAENKTLYLVRTIVERQFDPSRHDNLLVLLRSILE
jgi:hypothetical protein